MFQVFQMTKGESSDELVLGDPSPHDESRKVKRRNRVLQSCIPCHELRRKVRAVLHHSHTTHPSPNAPRNRSTRRPAPSSIALRRRLTPVSSLQCDRLRPCTRCSEHGVVSDLFQNCRFVPWDGGGAGSCELICHSRLASASTSWRIPRRGEGSMTQRCLVWPGRPPRVGGPDPTTVTRWVLLPLRWSESKMLIWTISLQAATRPRRAHSIEEESRRARTHRPRVDPANLASRSLRRARSSWSIEGAGS